MAQLSISRKKEKVVYKKKLSKSEKRVALLSRITIWAMILIVIFPIVAVVSASMAKGQAFTQGTLFPKDWTFENYSAVINETDFFCNNKKVPVSMSFGISGTSKLKFETVEQIKHDLLFDSLGALAQAKQEGKNCCILKQ